jgi:UDP-3-O-[3-hydroxymyristoyl] glucosamine N-acyltransferase
MTLARAGCHSMRLSEIAERFGFSVEGDGTREIHGVAGLDDATPADLTFLANPRYTPKLRTTRAAAVIVSQGVTLADAPIPIVRAPDAYLAFAEILELFYAPPEPAPGIHPTAVIAPTAHIGAEARIGAHVVIGERVVIGDRVTIHPNCTVYFGARIGDDCCVHSNCAIREFVRIGARCRLQNNVTVGGDGFGYAKRPDKSWRKIAQSGTVIIEDDVEIGAGAQIDRASVGETRIGRGSKIDNLVQVGHGSQVGRDTLLCAQVGLAGSSVVGDRVILAGQVGLAGHLRVGDDAVVTAQSGVPNDVAPGAVMSGYPAMENRLWLKSMAVVRQLPELQREVRRLQERLAEMERARAADGKEGQ